MSHTKVNYEDTETQYGMHFLRDELGCEDHGFTVVDAEPNWEGPEHDHDEQEEIYYLVSGGATITVEGEDIAMEPGDALRVSAGDTRQVLNGDAESQFVMTGAP